MTKVVVQNGNVDAALKKFKIKVAKSGVPSELKKHKEYKKYGNLKVVETNVNKELAKTYIQNLQELGRETGINFDLNVIETAPLSQRRAYSYIAPKRPFVNRWGKKKTGGNQLSAAIGFLVYTVFLCNKNCP